MGSVPLVSVWKDETIADGRKVSVSTGTRPALRPVSAGAIMQRRNEELRWITLWTRWGIWPIRQRFST